MRYRHMMQQEQLVLQLHGYSITNADTTNEEDEHVVFDVIEVISKSS
jgi:phage portal protein BeeE